MLKAMARHRSERYAGTEDLKADLLRFMRGGAEFPQTTFARGSVIMREGEAGSGTMNYGRALRCSAGKGIV